MFLVAAASLPSSFLLIVVPFGLQSASLDRICINSTRVSPALDPRTVLTLRKHIPVTYLLFLALHARQPASFSLTLGFNYNLHSRYTAWWSPRYLQYRPGTIHSYCNVRDYIPCAVLYIPMTILLTTNLYFSTPHPFHPVSLPPSQLASISESQLHMCLLPRHELNIGLLCLWNTREQTSNITPLKRLPLGFGLERGHPV